MRLWEMTLQVTLKDFHLLKLRKVGNIVVVALITWHSKETVYLVSRHDSNEMASSDVVLRYICIMSVGQKYRRAWVTFPTFSFISHTARFNHTAYLQTLQMTSSTAL